MCDPKTKQRRHHRKLRYALEETQDGQYRTVRHELEKRGWEAVGRSSEADLVWTLDERSIDFDSNCVANHFKNVSSVATKAGITKSMEDLRWNAFEDSREFFPRSYRLDDPDSRAAFVQDFQRTAACALLKNHSQSADEHVLELALRVCICWLDELETNPGGLLQSESTLLLSARQWQQLLDYGQNYSSLGQTVRRPATAPPQSTSSASLAVGVRSLRELGRTKRASTRSAVAAALSTPHQQSCAKNSEALHRLRTTATRVMRRLRNAWPQWDMDGSKNIWILKAPEACRGHGIVLNRRLDQILAIADRMPGRIVQKYVENSMTWVDKNDCCAVPRAPSPVKFDLRLWCLFVCDNEETRTYLYEPCYARLCSQPFTLEDEFLGSPCVHLSNLAVQRREHAEKNDSFFMRTQCELEFQLATGHSTIKSPWSTKVRPGIERIVSAIGATVVASASPRARSFELVGVDVILDINCAPWLLEVNLSPAFARRSESHSKNIASMLDGVLRRTVDVWFPSSNMRSDHSDDGWSQVCAHTTPLFLPPQRSLELVGKSIGNEELWILDKTLTNLQGWDMLRRWWKHTRPTYLARRLRRSRAQILIAHLARNRLMRKAVAAECVSRNLGSFVARRRARRLLAFRLTCILLIQACLRQYLVRARTEPMLRKRRVSAWCIAKAVVRWQLLRRIAERTRAVGRAVQVAQISFDCVGATVACATTAVALSSRRHQSYIVRIVRAVVLLQAKTRRRSAISRVSRKRAFILKTLAAKVLQSFFRRRSKIRMEVAALCILRVLRPALIRRLRRIERLRSKSIQTLQRWLLAILEHMRKVRAIKVLLTISAHARFCYYVRQLRKHPQQRLLTLDEFMSSLGIDEFGERSLLSDIEQKPETVIDSPRIKTKDAVSNVYKSAREDCVALDPFLLELARSRSRMTAAPHNPSLHWQHGKKSPQKKRSSCSGLVDTRTTSHQTTKKHATKKKSRKKTSTSQLASLALWAGSPR